MRVHIYKEFQGETRYMVEPSLSSGLTPVVLRGKDKAAMRQALRETIEVVASFRLEQLSLRHE